jgi:hypothetical protein
MKSSPHLNCWDPALGVQVCRPRFRRWCEQEAPCNRPWIDHSTALELIQSCRGRVEQFLNFVDSRETLRMRLAAGATAEELYVGFDSVIARWFKENSYTMCQEILTLSTTTCQLKENSLQLARHEILDLTQVAEGRERASQCQAKEMLGSSQSFPHDTV